MAIVIIPNFVGMFNGNKTVLTKKFTTDFTDFLTTKAQRK